MKYMPRYLYARETYLFIFPFADDRVKTVERSRRDKQYVGSVDFDSFLWSRSTPVFVWYIDDGTLE